MFPDGAPGEMPYALCGSCSADARDTLGAFDQRVEFLPVLAAVEDVPLPFPASCPNCDSLALAEIRDDDRRPADASARLICLDCSGVVGVIA